MKMSTEGETLPATPPTVTLLEPGTIKWDTSLDVSAEKMGQGNQLLNPRKCSMAMGRGILMKAAGRDRSNSEYKPKSHIQFRDTLHGQKIADVKLVESYKEYNVLPDDPKECACNPL